MKAKKKKKWMQPQLVVLMKGRPEESILTGCKNGGNYGPNSPNYCNNGDCTIWVS